MGPLALEGRTRMKGRNELVLNQATMIDALEEYLRKRMPGTPLKVESVKAAASDRCRTSFEDGCFTVGVATGDEPVAKGGAE